jgi:hypothetical protein
MFNAKFRLEADDGNAVGTGNTKSRRTRTLDGAAGAMSQLNQSCECFATRILSEMRGAVERRMGRRFLSSL